MIKHRIVRKWSKERKCVLFHIEESYWAGDMRESFESWRDAKDIDGVIVPPFLSQSGAEAAVEIMRAALQPPVVVKVYG